MTDAAGTRSIAYNRYGEAETDELTAGSMTHTITEQRDTLGRSTGYIYAKNDIPQQQTSIGYGADGRVASAGFTHQGEQKDFIYSYLPGTHLLHTLAHPNGLTLTQSYDNDRDLPTQMDYSRADALVVQRAYTYDLLGRPTARNLARYGTETQDTFGYNTRSELTAARVNSADYSYAYDAIGNRTSATEAGTRTAYTANKLNQYTAEGSFRPTFDADGNQTLIKTSTGTWNVTYNAKNRPIRFVKSDNSVIVECTYDTMGRRATKKVTTNGTLTEHRRFLYRGYLQIACCDLTRAYTPALWFITWDPTQETATRPLAIQKNGTWYTYGWDLTKNICETYRTDARIDLAYTYTPYGEVSPAHTYDQPLRWSSEYHDTELGLVYYNYRHYNPAMGKWMGRDQTGEYGSINLYKYSNNDTLYHHDYLGLDCKVLVNRRDCSIEFKIRIILLYDDSVPEGDTNLIAHQIESTIENEWNGHKKGCCDVIIDVILAKSSVLYKLRDVFTSQYRRTNYINITYNQNKGHNGTNRSYVKGKRYGTFVTSAKEVHGSHNPRTDFATWGYAHEAGHLMLLPDGYDTKTNKILDGYTGSEIMSAPYNTVKQKDIDMLTEGIDCPC